MSFNIDETSENAPLKLSYVKRLFSDAGIPDANYDAEAIFSDIGGFSTLDIRLSDPESSSEAVISAVKRRLSREPLQYVIGKTYFYKECYTVDPSCLIPRQDTEILVDYAVSHLPRGAYFLDLCSGSGCVGISTLKNTEGTTAKFADVSEDALRLAEKNANDNGVLRRAVFVNADVLKEPLDERCFAVLSNPPYVLESEYRELEPEIGFEPKIAFIGGDDGLDFYRTLVPMYKDVIDKDGFIAFEIGASQAESLREIARDNEMLIEVIKDLSGNDRVAVLRRC